MRSSSFSPTIEPIEGDDKTISVEIRPEVTSRAGPGASGDDGRCSVIMHGRGLRRRPAVAPLSQPGSRRIHDEATDNGTSLIEAIDLSKRYEDGVLALDRLNLAGAGPARSTPCSAATAPARRRRSISS